MHQGLESRQSRVLPICTNRIESVADACESSRSER